ncbi:MAG: 50S ribosomal protein L31e [Thermoprotei archaeon]|nr:MAG: 50S ribosomal protein L31e [Thermofilum sp. ex4484_79]RLE61410.1 MAG: 50S ribosomal protein L31e [Thermoprotei archaeon]HDD64230.1 50S ribosomal protein L31e [Thermoprotei archaeon]
MSETPLKVEEERVYVIPLRDAYYSSRRKRGKKCVTIIREFIRRHMKDDDIVIRNDVNEYIFSRSIEKPPRRIKVVAKKVYDEEMDRRYVEVTLYREGTEKEE